MNVAAQATEHMQVVRAASHAGARAGAATPAVITAIAAMQLRKAVLQANEQVKKEQVPFPLQLALKSRSDKRKEEAGTLIFSFSFLSNPPNK